MCGIAGVYGIDGIKGGEGKSGVEIAVDAVSRMVKSMHHRGPDSNGEWSDHQVIALGHTRLSIIDTVSPGANQPLVETEDVLVFNGEIYNFKSLKEELSTFQEFTTDSDTEVVLAALKAWGLDKALKKFNGMFAFGWWDSRRGVLSLARDRFGIKPVYWARANVANGGEAILFASEVRTLLESNLLERRVNRDALVDYLRYSTVLAPATIVEGIQLLEPGCAMEIHDEEVEIFRWWNTASEALKVPFTSRSVLIKNIRDTLYQSVEERMLADVPLGAFLSGGIDSTAVVGLMSEIAPKPIDSFTVALEDATLDESGFAKKMSERFRTNHHELRLSPEAMLEQVPDALDAMDHPSFDGLNTYVVSGATRKAGVTVALSGLGSDEIFAGYPVFDRSVQLLKQSWLAAWPRGLRLLAGSAYKVLKGGESASKKAEILASNYFDLEHTYPLSRQLILDSDIKKLLGTKTLPPNAVYEWITSALKVKTDGFALPFLSKVSLAELHTYLGHTLLRDADQFSMAHALEVRTPFLDHNLVKLVLSVEDSEKGPIPPKGLLVEALEGLVPPEVALRQKQGFVLQWDDWIKGPLAEIYKQGIDALADSGLLEEAALLEMEKGVSWSRKWSLSVLGNYIHRQRLS